MDSQSIPLGNSLMRDGCSPKTKCITFLDSYFKDINSLSDTFFSSHTVVAVVENGNLSQKPLYKPQAELSLSQM